MENRAGRSALIAIFLAAAVSAGPLTVVEAPPQPAVKQSGERVIVPPVANRMYLPPDAPPLFVPPALMDEPASHARRFAELPEPAAFALIGSGLLLLGVIRRRRGQS